MSIAGTPRWSLRLERAEVSRLTWAFAISLALHLLVFGTYQTGKKYNLWQSLHWPAWLLPPKIFTELLPKKEEPRPSRLLQDIPLVFVNVSPAQASAEPPKNAKFYSDKNSLAANPVPDKIADVPKITGKQDVVPKAEEVPREKFAPLQPSRPAQQAQAAQPELKPKPAQPPGDLVMAKPSPTPRETQSDANEAKPDRPRKLSQVVVRQQDSRPPGEKIKQEGGVRHRELDPGFDVMQSPFGDYDRDLINAIRERWYSLLNEREYASDSVGKVVLQFRLHSDGRITDMKEGDNTAGYMLGYICQKAVLDPAPFAAWPSDMRRTLDDTRNIHFTFYYY